MDSYVPTFRFGTTANTAVQYKLFINGTVSGVQAATTVPDDIALELKAFVESSGTNANHLATDYIQTVQQR